MFWLLCFLYAEEYLLKPTQEYFNDIEWAENKTLDFSLLPSPYEIGSDGIDSAFLYADNIKDDDILPEVVDLGILDYSRTPLPLLKSMRTFATSIVNKKLSYGLSAEGRLFLTPLFEYRLANMKHIEKIDYVFFSSPTFEGQEKAVVKFRFNYKKENIPKYRLMEATFTKEKEAWMLASFDFIGWEVDDSTK